MRILEFMNMFTPKDPTKMSEADEKIRENNKRVREILVEE